MKPEALREEFDRALAKNGREALLRDRVSSTLREASVQVRAVSADLRGLLPLVEGSKLPTTLIGATGRYAQILSVMLERVAQVGVTEGTAQIKSDIDDAIGYATGVLMPWSEAAQERSKKDEPNAKTWRELARVIDQMVSLADDATALVRRLK